MGVGVTEGLADGLRWAAFDLLRTGRPAPITDVAVAVRVDSALAEAAASELAGAGLLERDRSGVVVGAHGLTLLATRHQLVLDGVELHTWCALDAIRIPAALDADATVTTACGRCQRTLRVRVKNGVVSGEAAVVLWLPTSPCDNVREEFCPLANLFCDADHLESWRRRADDTSGEVLSLEQAAEVGRQWWSRTPGGCCDAGPSERR
jgi:alkylmercury lyase